MRIRDIATTIATGLAVMMFLSGCATTDCAMKMKGTSGMYYIVEREKTFEQASQDLTAAVKNNGFGILHVHNLGETLRSKGIDFREKCNVFEVCNPKQASRVMSADMRLNMALPCRISVFTEKGQTKIGMIKPEGMLKGLSSDPVLADVAGEVEQKTMAMIDEAR